MRFFSTPLLNCPKSECLAMYIGQSCGDRCSYGGRENPEPFLGSYLIKSYDNPAIRTSFCGVHRSSIMGIMSRKIQFQNFFLKEESL